MRESSKGMGGRDTTPGGRKGVCTSALLLNDAKSAGDGLAVGKHSGGCFNYHAVQTIHGARPVVRVAVAVDDADEEAGHAHGKLLCVGLAVFSENKSSNGSNGLEAAMRG